MIAAAIIHIGVSLYRFWESSTYYADVVIGDRRDAVLYGVGRPTEVLGTDGTWHAAGKSDDATARAWGYSTATGGRVEVSFDPANDTAARVSCAEPEVQPNACPPLFRIDLGTDEGTLLRRLGAPTRAHLEGESKVMVYADLGAEYTLKRYVVFRITAVADRGSLLSRTGRILRSIVP